LTDLFLSKTSRGDHQPPLTLNGEQFDQLRFS
jgi:hypothetical protein